MRIGLFYLGWLALLVSGCSPPADGNPRIDEIGADKVRWLTDLADKMEKCAEFCDLKPLLGIQMGKEHEFAQHPWSLQKPILDKYGKEFEVQEQRIANAMKRFDPGIDGLGERKIHLMKQLAKDLRESDKESQLKSAAALARINQEVAEVEKKSERIKNGLAERFGRKFQEEESHLEAARTASQKRIEKKP